MYNTTENVISGSKNLTNGVVYSTPQKNIAKSETNRKVVVHPSTTNARSNNSGSLFASSSSHSSRVISNETDQNFYRKTDLRYASSSSSSHDTRNTLVQQTKNDSFFDMLQDYKPAVLGVIGTNQRSPGPAEFMLDKDNPIQYHPPIQSSNKHSHSNTNYQTDSSSSSNVKITRDLKVKNKIHRFLVHPKPKTDDNSLLGLSILTKNFSINEEQSHSSVSSSTTTPTTTPTITKKTYLSTEEMQEQQRQRPFGHYDCQSLAASMNYIKTSKRNSTTNNISSSATTITKQQSLNSISSDLKNLFNDLNHGNELLENCLHFCNEIGGENDGRFSSKKSTNNIDQNGLILRPLHRRPVTPCSVSIVESLPNETLWRVGVCPFQNDSCPIESVDHGAHYYKRYFFNQKHENWFGIDENLGPIAISIKKEKLQDNSCNDQQQHTPSYQFRMIIRTSELLTLRGLVIEDCIINSRVSGKSVTSKELVEFIAPDIQLSCLRLGVSTSNCEQQLLKLDEQGLQSKYKVGILYCRSGQSSEEDMYNNEHPGPAFTEFLEIIGKRVRLKGFQQYKAGLDNKSDSTGTHSVYAFYKNCEIMFHVCTMLPFTPNNRQQLLRKRHIGNDIVTIIFQEPGALPFDPNSICSQFQHVFLIVRAVNPCSNNTTYRVAITRSKDVPVFGPPLPASALFSRNKMFAEFILAKTINAENAAHRSDKFANLAIRTRREYLKDLCINYCTNTSIDPANKFSIFANRKKEKMKIQFSGDLSQRGAICWRILLQDHGLDNMTTECFLGISIETFVIIQESSKTVIFAMPTRSILGWTTCDNFFRIFYHNGECITFSMFYLGAKDDEQQQVIERLEAVTMGNSALELNMRRNMMGQLGFHVQPDGIVTQVDATGQGWAAGMRRGYRLVEVCKIVVATLSYAELIDLLKTSAQMNAIVIKSISDGTPRLGCFNKNCKVNILSQEFVQSSSNKFLLEKDGYRVKSFLRKESAPDQQHSVLNYKNNSGSYEQRSLPHKSKNNSSGYNTGSSCFSSNSLGDEYKKTLQQSNSSSPHSLQNDKWYDTTTSEDLEQKKKTSYSLNNHQYSLKSFDSSLKFEESTGLTVNSNSNTSPLFHGDGSRVQSWLQNGTSTNLPQSDQSRKLQHRGPEYEMTGFKSINLSPQSDSRKFQHRGGPEYEVTGFKSINLSPQSDSRKLQHRGGADYGVTGFKSINLSPQSDSRKLQHRGGPDYEVTGFKSINLSPQSDSRKLQHRGPEYDVTGFKNINLSPQSDSRKLQHRSPEYKVTGLNSLSPIESYSFDKGIITRHSESSENIKTTEFKSGLKDKNTFHEITAIPSTLAVKTAKVGAAGLNVLNQSSINSIQQSISNYSRTNQFRPDLLEIISPNCFSYYDSLKANMQVVEKNGKLQIADDNIRSPKTNSIKNPEKHQTFQVANSDDNALKKHQHNLCASGSSIRHKQRSGQDPNSITTAPPLLPYSKELDWSTLVDTATKAIILQHRDENSYYVRETHKEYKRGGYYWKRLRLIYKNQCGIDVDDPNIPGECNPATEEAEDDEPGFFRKTTCRYRTRRPNKCADRTEIDNDVHSDSANYSPVTTSRANDFDDSGSLASNTMDKFKHDTIQRMGTSESGSGRWLNTGERGGASGAYSSASASSSVPTHLTWLKPSQPFKWSTVSYSKTRILYSYGYGRENLQTVDNTIDCITTPMALIPVDFLPFYLSDAELTTLPSVTPLGTRTAFDTGTTTSGTATSEYLPIGMYCEGMNVQFYGRNREYGVDSTNPMKPTSAKAIDGTELANRYYQHVNSNALCVPQAINEYFTHEWNRSKNPDENKHKDYQVHASGVARMDEKVYQFLVNQSIGQPIAIYQYSPQDGTIRNGKQHFVPFNRKKDLVESHIYRPRSMALQKI